MRHARPAARTAAAPRLEEDGLDAPRRLVDEAPGPGCRRAFPAGARGARPWIAATRLAARPAPSPAASGRPRRRRPGRAPSRAGRGRRAAGSIPAASIAASPSSRRLVPRTAQPSAEQPLARAPAAAAAADDQRPRHRPSARGSPVELDLLGGDLLRSSRLVELRGAAAAAHLVLRLDHLAHVVDLVLDLDLGRAGRVPVDQVGVAAAVEVADHDQNADEEEDDDNGPEDEDHGPRISRLRPTRQALFNPRP